MHQKKKQWTSEEIQLLQTIKKTHKQKKWKLISKNLAKKGFKRTQHECRHKWVNCLNPEINHGPWTEQELQTLYIEYEKNHSQWSTIQKALPNRTQIRIKNHFYGVLRNIMRFILKYFKDVPGRQSQISNKINPNSLQLIYRGEGQYSFVQKHVKNAILSMDYHFEKQKLVKILQKNKEIYVQLNEKLLEQTSKNKFSDSVENSLAGEQEEGKKNNTEYTLPHINSQKMESSTGKYEYPKKEQAISKIPNISQNPHNVILPQLYSQPAPLSCFPNSSGFLFYLPQFTQSYPLTNYLNPSNLLFNFSINQ